jgi:hypothetical protein
MAKKRQENATRKVTRTEPPLSDMPLAKSPKILKGVWLIRAWASRTSIQAERSLSEGVRGNAGGVNLCRSHYRSAF